MTGRTWVSRRQQSRPKRQPQPQRKPPARARKPRPAAPLARSRPRIGRNGPRAHPGNNTVLMSLHRSPLHSSAYWDAASHRKPPHLSTSFGNYTCVNSVSRFAQAIPPSTVVMYAFLWTPSAIRTFSFSAPSSTGAANGPYVNQQTQLNANNTVPLDVRPLRMSVRFRNTTSLLNRGGTVYVAQIPQSYALEFTGINAISATSFTNLWNLVSDNPDTKVFNGAALGANHTIVASPSAFMKYNSYGQWVPMSTPPNSDNGSLIAQADWLKLISCGPFYQALPVLPTFPFVANDGAFGDMPSNYMTLLAFDTVAAQQSYEIEVFCQDAVRYPASSMAASVKHTPGDPTRTMTDAQALASATAAASQPIHPSTTLESTGQAVGVAVESGAGALLAPRVAGAVGRLWRSARAGASMAGEEMAGMELLPLLAGAAALA